MPERKDLPHKIADVLRAIGGHKEPKKYTSAVILAAGSSTRMNGQSKQFITLDGMPIIARTVMQFEAAECINEIILVVKSDEEHMYADFPEKYGITKPFSTVIGGETRQESARLGSDAVSGKSRFICIHDGARCLITPELITRVCRNAYEHRAAVLGISAVDTVKLCDKNRFVESTPERKHTYQAQTPQVFEVNAYRAAAYVARDEGIEATDDASLLEHIKIPVKLVESSRENIKITDRGDIIYAEAILKARKESLQED